MTLDELTPWLFSRTAGGIRWGLETTRELLAGVGDPHRRFHSVHIAGTNGKGSVAALCDGALREGGRHRVGLYTSPHLVSFAERVRIDGRPAPDAAIMAAAERLLPAIERTGATFFEATTAIAFLCFAEAGVDVAVVEVGLGGRLDATNVLSPVITAVTNVSREHTEYLGDTVEEIAAEKAGIFKPGVPALSAAAHPGVRAVLAARAAEVGAPLVELDDVTRVRRVETDLHGTRLGFDSELWGERELRVPLPGEHQARNALLAVELLARLPASLRPGWPEVERGMAAVRWPGRLQVVERLGTTWLFDVAHNPAGAQTLARALDSMDLPRPLLLLVAVLADKEWPEMLAPLAARADSVVLTTAPSAPPSRRWDPRAAAEWLAQERGVRARVVPDLAAAVRRASTLVPHGTVLVTGSFHTVGDAMAELGVPAG
ncbi:MAG TPA: folylpolyglutamate synthase/dihydrofolate synthase family protein [Longimicrobiaceae bacterium]|nr:folylpolyglutamate synthase/dihydrofolate synthase family protein [Longimicrobiaceae bacterium]